MNKRNRTVLGVVLVAASASGFFACGGRLDDEAVTTATDDAGEEPSADATTSDASSFRDAAIADDAGSSNLAEAAVDAGPPPPRLIAPLSTALVTTRRPTLHWSLPAAETDVMLDLCRDRACADPIAASVPVTGSTYTPASDLPSGVVFWRARSTVTSVSSATWEFRVGASSTPIDTSGGTFLDLNGDGLADIATTELSPLAPAGGATDEPGRVYVYLGKSSGLPSVPDFSIDGPDGSYGWFGKAMSSAGDVNGDGFGDLVIGAEAAHALLFLGSPTGPVTSSPIVFEHPGVDWTFGFSVTSVGDANGDGYADIATMGCVQDTLECSAYLYAGSANGPAKAPTRKLHTAVGANTLWGGGVAGVGDVNGDGFGDLAVGFATQGQKVGQSFLYLGGIDDYATPPIALTPTAGEVDHDGGNQTFFGSPIAAAGDVNGDGYADMLVGSIQGSQVDLYLGGSTITGLPSASLVEDHTTWFVTAVASAGDVNGDGYGDVVLGSIETGAEDLGEVVVFYGGAAGLSTASRTVVLAPDPDRTSFGNAVASAGDVDRDGFGDLLVGAPNEGRNGRAFVYRGTATGIATTPATTYVGTTFQDGDYGWQVCGAAN